MLNKYFVRRPAAVWLTALLLTALLLVGCGAPAATETAPTQESPTEESSEAEPPANVEAETIAGTVEPDPTQAVDSEAGQEEAEPAVPEVVASGPASCQADNLGLVENEAVPALSEDDWALGPETAAVTIIEYGDFQ